MPKKTVIILLVVFAAIGVKAQSFIPSGPDESEKEKKKGISLKVHSVNASLGMYSPKMDYWNDSYLPSEGSTDELGSSLVIGANITFAIASEFRVRTGVSYWSDSAEKSGIGLNELKISFTRFSIGGLYAPEFASFGVGFQVYAGLEGYYYDINNTLDMKSADGVSTSEEQNGHDVSFAPVIGLDKVFGDHLIVGAEFSYMFGEYNQAEIVESAAHKVSIAGPQLSLSVGYKF